MRRSRFSWRGSRCRRWRRISYTLSCRWVPNGEVGAFCKVSALCNAITTTATCRCWCLHFFPRWPNLATASFHRCRSGSSISEAAPAQRCSSATFAFKLMLIPFANKATLPICYLPSLSLCYLVSCAFVRPNYRPLFQSSGFSPVGKFFIFVFVHKNVNLEALKTIFESFH